MANNRIARIASALGDIIGLDASDDDTLHQHQGSGSELKGHGGNARGYWFHIPRSNGINVVRLHPINHPFDGWHLSLERTRLNGTKAEYVKCYARRHVRDEQLRDIIRKYTGLQ